MLNKFDRPFISAMTSMIPQRIPSASVAKICESLGLSVNDFRQILLIEDRVYTNIVRQYTNAQKSKSNEVLH